MTLLPTLAPPAAARLAHYRQPPGRTIPGVMNADDDPPDADPVLVVRGPVSNVVPNRIDILRLAAKHRIGTPDVASALGMSRTGARMALRRLHAADLLACVQEASGGHHPAYYVATEAGIAWLEIHGGGL